MSEAKRTETGEAAPTHHPAEREWQLSDLAPVLEALQGRGPFVDPLKTCFGSVEVFIRDSRLVQIDRKEKIRPLKN